MSVPYFHGADFKLDIAFQKFWAKISKFGHFRPESINSLTLTKCRMNPISKVLISITNFKTYQIWPKTYQLSNLNEILPVPYFEGADFKSDICFRKFRAQIPRLGHFGQKSINFLIITNFACSLFWRWWFQIWHSIYVVLSILVLRLHEPIQCSRFVTYLENIFSFFSQKSQNIMALKFIFWKLLFGDKTLKKSKHILSLTI